MNPYDPNYNRNTPQNSHPNHPSYPYPNNPQGMPQQGYAPGGPPYHTPPQRPYAPPQRILPTQRVKLDAPPQKRRGCLAAILPWGGDTFGEVFRKLIFLLAFSAFCFCGYLLYVEYALPLIQNNSLLEEQRNAYYQAEIGEDDGVDGLKLNVIQPKFRKLYQENPDIVGWVKINNTRVDYPVYQSAEEDPEYYLKRTVKGEYSAYGTIFMDARIDITDYRNLILYGHHMADGSMFAQIPRYKDLDFYKKTPTITFDSIYEDAEWKVFSVFITNTKPEHGKGFYFIRTKFEDDTDYMGFVTQLRVRSILDIPVDVRSDDQILMLSTCSYEFDGFRTVVCARRVRPGESASVDVSLAKAAANPLYPDVWYRKFGGTPPEVPDTESDGTYQQSIELDPFTKEENQ